MVLYHYGNTTGVMQVNDTHLHGPFKKIYLGYDMDTMMRQMESDLADINRSREQVLGRT